MFKLISYSSRQAQIVATALAGCSLIASLNAYADCEDDIETLDESYSSAGYMLNDSSVTTTSGYLSQSRSLRDSALILMSNDRDDECVRLISEAQKLVNKASRPSVFAAEEIVGREVVDPSGQEVGTIENIMVDLDRGIAAYALISFGGFLGLGEDLVPVPFGRLSQSVDKDALEISTSFARIENAPRYIENDWDLLSRRSWATDVFNYYGEDPYWVERRSRPQNTTRVSGMNAGASQSMKSDPEENDVANTSSDSGEDQATTQKVEPHEPLRGFDHLFKVLDEDSNGELSQDEARREFAVYKEFLDMDSDESGSLSGEEFAVIADSHRLSNDGETVIPQVEDALPEEKWTGGKEETEAAAD